MITPLIPLFKGMLNVGVGDRRIGPLIYLDQVRACLIKPAICLRQADVFDLVASRTNRHHTHQGLRIQRIVVQPDLVGFDRMLSAAATTDLTLTVGDLVSLLANHIPNCRGYDGSDIGEPTAAGY